MANYTQLSRGSRGSDVKKLQKSLINAGYSVGASGVDGSYGPATASAVTQYQKDKGLKVDGIAGAQTLGSLYGTKSGSIDAKTFADKPVFDKTFDWSQFGYDPTADDAYNKALKDLLDAQENMPTYGGTYDQQLKDIMDKIQNRDKFTYDLNGDALYQQYKDQYIKNGNIAMQDTIGQAASMTGGYGNSYAQSVGQQTYQGYLGQLNDKVPELYQLALNQYNQEGQDMMNQYKMIGDMANDEYSKYLDSLNQYWQNLSFLKEQADDAYDRGYTRSRDEASDAWEQYMADYEKWKFDTQYDQWQQEFDYQKEKDSKSNSGGGGGYTYSYDPPADEDKDKDANSGLNDARKDEIVDWMARAFSNVTSVSFNPRTWINGSSYLKSDEEREYALQMLDVFSKEGGPKKGSSGANR